MNSVSLLLWMLPLIGLLSYWLTGKIVAYALQKNILDFPNQRSSHTVATPRGGGLSIVVTYSLSIVMFTLVGVVAVNVACAIVGSGMLVALIGWLDDRYHIAIKVRLLVQFLAVMWGMYWLGAFHFFTGSSFPLDCILYFFMSLFLVWLLNLYNFMDGINGIATIEAITVCVGAGILAWLTIPELTSLVFPVFALMFSAVGFLFWNFPKAKVFMGDSGSGFLGLALGVLALDAGLVKLELLWGWLILLGVFVVDASTTLAWRVFHGERFYEAHCTHAYQHAARLYTSHVKVSLFCGAINIFWLLPLAVLVSVELLQPALGLIIAYLPLCFGAVFFNAGRNVVSRE